LDGHPQNHVTWCKVAPRFAESYSVVAPDLPGYGDSGKPPGGAGHVNYSKRAMAQHMIEVMRRLGFERFAIMGHDRGDASRIAVGRARHCRRTVRRARNMA
jgi:haloacetate dehalogenase